eukprot:SAG25_NODE_239_length_11223_cov_67.665049_5_plen_61_part_00
MRPRGGGGGGAWKSVQRPADIRVPYGATNPYWLGASAQFVWFRAGLRNGVGATCVRACMV